MKKDRGYITATEWKTEWGGNKDRSKAPFRRLPFHCCAISFTPFEDPVRAILRGYIAVPQHTLLIAGMHALEAEQVSSGTSARRWRTTHAKGR